MKHVTLINLTPHDVVICNNNNIPQITIPPSGLVIRCPGRTKEEGVVHIGNTNIIPVPLTLTEYEKPTVPGPAEGVIYVVSELVARMFPERDDFRIINGKIRINGKVVGCRSLGRIP